MAMFLAPASTRETLRRNRWSNVSGSDRRAGKKCGAERIAHPSIAGTQSSRCSRTRYRRSALASVWSVYRSFLPRPRPHHLRSRLTIGRWAALIACCRTRLRLTSCKHLCMARLEGRLIREQLGFVDSPSRTCVIPRTSPWLLPWMVAVREAVMSHMSSTRRRPALKATVSIPYF